MQEREHVTQTKCKEVAERRGAWVTKLNQDSTTERGRPDLVMCYKGVFIACEIKRPNGTYKATEAQRIVGRKIIKAGGYWYVVDNPAEMERILDEIDDLQRIPNEP